MANSLLRPPQANNDAPSRVAPVVVSGLGVVTSLADQISSEFFLFGDGDDEFYEVDLPLAYASPEFVVPTLVGSDVFLRDYQSVPRLGASFSYLHSGFLVRVPSIEVLGSFTPLSAGFFQSFLRLPSGSLCMTGGYRLVFRFGVDDAGLDAPHFLPRGSVIALGDSPHSSYPVSSIPRETRRGRVPFPF